MPIRPHARRSSDFTRGFVLPALVALLGSAGTAQGAVLHVPQDFPSIQAAVDAAQPGDEILVAAGEYRENVSIDKAIALVSESGAEDTVINGRQKGSVVTIGSEFSRDLVRVSGFTLRNGYGCAGGGIVQLGGSMTIEDNRIVDNQADDAYGNCAGGGISVHGAATIRHNLVARNTASSGGAGMFVTGWDPSPPINIVDNVIENNVAGRPGGAGVGGGLSVGTSAAIQRNIIRYNTALGYLEGEDDTEVGGQGGGLWVWAGDMPVDIADNAIFGNNARFGAAGMTVIVEDAFGQGGRVVNNTIFGNVGAAGSQVTTGRYGSRITFANNVIASLDGTPVLTCYPDLDPDSPIFANNDVWAGGYPPAVGSCASTAVGGSNLSVDPRLATGTLIPCLPGPRSPLVDAGANVYAKKQPEDLLGHPRVVNGGNGQVIDIGACEYVPQ